MINNLQVLDYTKQYLLNDIEFIEKTDSVKINRLQKKLKLQRKTLWGDLVNPQTSICRVLDKIESFAMPCLGVVVTISALYSIIYGFGTIDPSLRPIVFEKIEQLLKTMSIPFFVNLPAVPMSLLRESIKTNFETKEEEINFLKEKLQTKIKNKENTLKVIEAVKKDPQMKTILNDVLNNVDLSNNGENFNKKLIELLSQATIDPNNETFHYVADYIRNVCINEPKYLEDDATKEFFDNHLIQDIMRTY